MIFWGTIVVLTIVCVVTMHIYGRQHKQSSNLQYFTFVALPFLSVPLYLVLGEPDAINTSVPPAHYEQAEKHDKVASIGDLLPGLEARVEADPSNGELWVLLGRSYEYVGRTDMAEHAFTRAEELGVIGEDVGSHSKQQDFGELGNDADVLANKADAVAVKNGTLTGEAEQYLRKALASNPSHVKALWLAGSLEVERGDHKAALSYWRRLQQLLPPDSEDADVIKANIQESNQQIDVAKLESPASTKRLTGLVSLDDAIRTSVNDSDTVFVVARAVNGPRMPLAVVRTTAKSLPFEFVLDDSNSMVPELALSKFDNIVVSARISQSGSANRSESDLESAQVPVVLGDEQNLNLVIGL